MQPQLKMHSVSFNFTVIRLFVIRVGYAYRNKITDGTGANTQSLCGLGAGRNGTEHRCWLIQILTVVLETSSQGQQVMLRTEYEIFSGRILSFFINPNQRSCFIQPTMSTKTYIIIEKQARRAPKKSASFSECLFQTLWSSVVKSQTFPQNP